jgi:YebC/PmpR family DNA-binding regulatory protein
MPKDNIERAVKRGTGELDGGNVEEVLYEGYGPGGVAVLCDILTDNRNRTASEIRKIFDVHEGKLGSSNCVAWMFERKGLFLIAANSIEEDKLTEIALEAGADDIQREGDRFELTCNVDAFSDLEAILAEKGIQVESKQIARIPSNTVELGAQEGKRVLSLLEALDDHDDVQSVSANFSIPDEVMAELAET